MSDEQTGKLERELGLSRRELIRRGLVVGGTLVWAVPAIQSIAGPAEAKFRGPNGSIVFTCCSCFKARIGQAQTACATDGFMTDQQCIEFCRSQIPGFRDVSEGGRDIHHLHQSGAGEFTCSPTPSQDRCIAPQ
jgi:hypothetical protein